ncbi:class I SAM-dependent methyltransferase [Halobacillus seohaensis]|uniref:Class I SAM-dependent methyltransferase n=1 Tax=Halobacillus seohaensis TaxID=447421 RepID=A0ABW2ER71_9BACI
MKLKRVLQYAHELMRETLKDGDIAIDATCGNGHDTLFLSQLIGKTGHVYAYDIQEQAIKNTSERLNENNLHTRATLFQESHDMIEATIPREHLEKLQGAIFNLGYLPGSDKSIVTTPEQTTESVQTILNFLQPSGLVVLVVYYGHPGGEKEKHALLQYVERLDQKSFNVLQYGFINQKNSPPFIVAIEKKKAH